MAKLKKKSNPFEGIEPDDLKILEKIVTQSECEDDHLFFSKYFFKQRQNINFIENWHHRLICDVIEKIISGELKNVVINVPPGSSKTELVVINFIARGLALNPRSRFLHLSYSDDLALLNSQTARDLITSDAYQELWPIKISDDTKSKKRWNVMEDGKPAGGVYATSLGGQITGFRAGHMVNEFSGCILIDDPLKPEDGFSKTKLNLANRKLLTTVKSRKAKPDTPIIVIMQRIAENDPVGFIKQGNLQGEWHFIAIPAVMTWEDVEKLKPQYQKMVPPLETVDSVEGRFSYWSYKERILDLLAMERGDGSDKDGSRVSRHVFASQYQQNPVAIGGNIIKGEYFERYKMLPLLEYRVMYADTAQKTKERNDYSVFQVWGKAPRSQGGKIYLIDQIRGKWESPDLRRRAVAFWQKHRDPEIDFKTMGNLREMKIEDKSSGTDLIQSLGAEYFIPVEAIERHKDKLTRVYDALPYIESKMVCVPEEAPFTNDFITECEAFTADDSHAHDDQVDPMLDAVQDMLSTQNSLLVWSKLAN